MSGYLSKEEIKQWRSSLEKITLEEFAQRLGKSLKEEKQTRDIVDLVLKNEPGVSKIAPSDEEGIKKKVVKVAQKAVDFQTKETKALANISEYNLTFKKPLTAREQTVLNVFLQNQDKIVYAKELAEILELPTDYVYKYIKNLRAKLGTEVLQNSTKGGYKICVSK